MSSTRGRAILVRAASSATIAMLLFSAVVVYLFAKDGWNDTRLTNAVALVSALWIFGWPFAIAMSAAKRLGTAWGKGLVTGPTPDASSSPPPSPTLAIVGAALFALSFLALGGVVARAIAPAIRDYQSQSVGGQDATRDPVETPELPMSFSATTDREALIAELELDHVWSTTHPEYDGEVRVLITSAPVEGLSPNYRAAFYYREGDAFVRIGTGFGFGGYHPPELGRHPTLDVPAIVCVSEAIPERTYFFVHDGVDQTFQENGDTWIPVDELR